MFETIALSDDAFLRLVDAEPGSDSIPAWECAGTDRPRYLRWLLECSRLPPLLLMGNTPAIRDVRLLKVARGFTHHLARWIREDWYLNSVLGHETSGVNRPELEKWLERNHGIETTEDFEYGEQLMMEILYYKISDEFQLPDDDDPYWQSARQRYHRKKCETIGEA